MVLQAPSWAIMAPSTKLSRTLPHLSPMPSIFIGFAGGGCLPPSIPVPVPVPPFPVSQPPSLCGWNVSADGSAAGHAIVWENKKTTPPISRQLQILEKRRTLDRAWSRLSLGSLTAPPPFSFTPTPLSGRPGLLPIPCPSTVHPPPRPLSPPRGQCRAAFIKTVPSIDRIAVADYTSTHWLPFLSSETLPQLLLVYAVLLCLRSRPRFVSEDQGSHCQHTLPTTNCQLFCCLWAPSPRDAEERRQRPFGDQYIAPPPRHRSSPHHQPTNTAFLRVNHLSRQEEEKGRDSPLGSGFSPDQVVGFARGGIGVLHVRYGNLHGNHGRAEGRDAARRESLVQLWRARPADVGSL